MLVLTADVDVVVLGGGVTALGIRLMTDVEAELAASAEASPFMRSLQLEQRVELLPAGSPPRRSGRPSSAPNGTRGFWRVAEIVIVPDAAAAGALVADEIARLIRTTPDAVLGLATGSTPVPVYQALPSRLSGVDVSRVRGFALDEYVGLDPATPRATAR